MNLHFISELGKEAMEFKISEIELVYKTKSSKRLCTTIKTSHDAYQVFMRYWDSGKIEFIEQFKVLLLNLANQVLGIMEVSSGGTSSSVVDSKLIFVSALKANANSIIIAYNHPSGSIELSNRDKQLTERLFQIGVLLELKLLDHLVITEEDYFSFADNGEM